MTSRSSWEDLRYFLAVAECQSMRAAGAALDVDHATVSRRLRELQRALGVRLLERIPKGYAMTAAGEEMLAVAGRVRDEIDDLDRRLSGRDMQLVGTLRITIAEPLSGLLAPAFAAFRTQYPRIQLEVVDSDAMASLARREADIAVRIASEPPAQLVGRRVAAYALAPYASQDLAEQVAMLPDIFRADWVGWDRSFDDAVYSRWTRARVPDAQIVARVRSSSMLRRLMVEGIGVGLLGCYAGDAEPRLIRLGDPVEPPLMHVWVLIHPDLRSSARVRTCADHLHDWLRAQRERFEGKVPEGW